MHTLWRLQYAAVYWMYRGNVRDGWAISECERDWRDISPLQAVREELSYW